MQNRFAFASLLAASLASVACTGGNLGTAGPEISPASPAPTTDDENPAWLAGSYVVAVSDERGDVETTMMTFDAGGSGHRIVRRTHWDVAGEEVLPAQPFEWSLVDGELIVDRVHYSAWTSDDCHLVQIGPYVYVHEWAAPETSCPSSPVPLTETESRFAGLWVSANTAVPSGSLRFGEGHRLVVDRDDEPTVELIYSIDEKHSLHGMIPDGTEVYQAELRMNGPMLTVCDRNDCTNLVRISASIEPLR